MKEFDVTISAVVQFTGKQEFDDGSKEIFGALNLENRKIRYVFLSYHQNLDQCEINTFYKGCRVPKTIINKSIYVSGSSGSALTEFFEDYVLKEQGETVFSKRHFLITIGHGAGFTFFHSQEEEVVKTIVNSLGMQPQNVSEEEIELKATSAVKARQRPVIVAANLYKKNERVPYDYDSVLSEFGVPPDSIMKLNDMISGDAAGARYLTLFEFAEILEKAFSKSKAGKGYNAPIDMMIMVNCYLQTLETGFALKNATRYLAATQRTIPLFGIDYKAFFDQLSNNPGVDCPAISEEMIELFQSKAKAKADAKPEAKEQKSRDVSMSINDLSFYDDILCELNKVAQWVIDNSNGPITPRLGNKNAITIIDETRNCGKFERIDMHENQVLGMIELRKFLRLFKDALIPGKENEKVKQFLQLWANLDKLLSKAIVCHCCDITLHSLSVPEGMGIFFPTRLLLNDQTPATEALRDIVHRYIENPEAFSLFTEKTKWDELLSLNLQVKGEPECCECKD